MATLSKRFEARLDEETDEAISRAASLLQMTKSAFVTRAARDEAERVLARGDVTLMAPEVFDRLMESLDMPDDAPELADRLSRLPRIR